MVREEDAVHREDRGTVVTPLTTLTAHLIELRQDQPRPAMAGLKFIQSDIIQPSQIVQRLEQRRKNNGIREDAGH